MATVLPTPVHTSEVDDVRAIVEYLGIPQSSEEVQSITGLTKSAISELLAGQRVRDTHQRRHIAIVATVIRRLREVREASTGTPERGQSALGWLHSARVVTSRGSKTPIEILADSSLALEALDGLDK